MTLFTELEKAVLKPQENTKDNEFKVIKTKKNSARGITMSDFKNIVHSIQKTAWYRNIGEQKSKVETQKLYPTTTAI